jgi:predicted CoA-binding protein
VTRSDIQQFLTGQSFAVAGASRDPQKYGNKVFQALLKTGRQVFPLNPGAAEIDRIRAYPDLKSLPLVPECLSIVTPPDITASVIAAAIEVGVKSIWMQPGAEHRQASEQARQAGCLVIDDGSCLLVALALERHRR